MNIKEQKNTIITVAFYVLLFLSVYLTVKYALIYIFPFILGFFIAMSIKNISISIGEKAKIKSRYISFIILTALYIIFLLCVYFLSSNIFSEIEEIADSIPAAFNLFVKPAINGIVERLSENVELHEYVSSALNSVYERLSVLMISAVGSFISSLPGFLLSFVFTVISSYFFSADYYKITGYISKLLPIKYRKDLFTVKSIFTETILKMIKGYGLIMLITFSELFIGLTLLRVRDALIYSIFIAILDIMPIIGSGTFLIPASVISLFGGKYYLGIGLILLYLIITVIRNIIEPKIIGKHIGLHPIIMLLSIYLGGKLFGIIGILTVPIIITVIKEYLSDKNTISA